MSLFLNDDRAVTEPYTDLPALGLVAIGVLLFSYMVLSAYSSYEAKTYYADRKDDLRTMAVAIAADTSVACSGMSWVLEAQKLDNLSVRTDVFQGYGCPGEQVAAGIEGGIFAWSGGRHGDGTRSASYRLPVAIKLNDALCVPGTLTVTASGGSG
ncbi:MAG: hypothetical protein A4E28_00132 [Methanocella sp. PtaU1.Bin125]|nr:MAG: hypothetical protein A4E28_00132 [Methanocella sp. PtaU1.Bin125]